MLIIENNYKDIDYDIILELYRGKQYISLQKSFFYSCINNLGSKVFTNKKNLNRTLSNLLSSWMFSLYSSYNFLDDPFFPTNYNNYNNLKKTLNDYCSIHNIDNVKNKINNIIKTLDTNYSLILDNIKNYKKKDFYKKYKKKYSIEKVIIKQKRDNIDIDFYKFKLNFNSKFNILNTKINNIINNLIIPINEYNKMINNYKKTNFTYECIDEIIWIILYRYQLLSSNNNQLGVLPSALDIMKKEFKLNFECFASAINTSTLKFSSIYYDVEKYFGSVGSFFNTKFLEGCFSFNPPYQKDIIDNGIIKIFEHLDYATTFDLKLSFIITIPIWDIEGKNIMKELDSENNNDFINYDDMEIMKKIKKSKYFNGLRMISKNDFTYIDHNFHLFKNKTIQNTYIIVLSNYKNNMIDTINNINFYN